VHNLRPQTFIRSAFHQRTLSLTRDKVGVFHSMASSNGQTDRAHQSRVRSVPPALCERIARRLVWPPTHGGVPAQQSCPLYHSIASVPARHWKTSSHGIQTPTEPFQSRDSQRVHGEDEDGNQRSQIHNPQGTERHEKVLRLTKNSGSGVQTWR